MDRPRGVELLGSGEGRFGVWAPRPARLELELLDRGQRLPLERDAQGYGTVTVPGVREGERYAYRLEGDRLRPDPASALQPEGVHGPSAVWDPRFAFQFDSFRPPPLRDWTLYELHAGTFSPAGDLGGVAARLGQLRELGVSALELMPVAPFPGARNWGYDGVSLTAVHAAYGGPRALQKLVDAAHEAGLAVVLDVVFNHFGPEGNYLAEFGPYFSSRHKTPWGDGINLDGPDSGPVRDFFVASAVRWFTDFHVDALRLDAVHSIADASPRHLLAEMQQAVQAACARLGRPGYLIAESDLGQSRVVRPVSEGGWGLDAQWSDDFHHALHARLTGERQGYYADFGSTTQVATALSRGYVYEGQHSVYRGRPFGDSTAGLGGERFVVCAQNHDQVGNRARGERLGQLVPPERARLAAAAVLLAPRVPLLFMGEEYGEPAPFLYFTSHTDPALARAVSEGRRSEFPAIAGASDVPDPQDEATFLRSRLHPELRSAPGHRERYALYRALLALRREHPSLACAPARVSQEGELIRVERSAGGERSVVLLGFELPGPADARLPGMTLALDTAWRRFGGPAPDNEAGPLRPWCAQAWLRGAP